MTLENSPSIRGLEMIRETLRYECFPSAKSELYYSIGDIEVEDGQGGYLPSRDVLDRIGQASFTSADEVLDRMREATGMAKKAA